MLAAGREEGREQGREEGREQGLRAGRIAAILAVLSARGLPLEPAARARIEACVDIAQLDEWIRRVATVRDQTALFDEA